MTVYKTGYGSNDPYTSYLQMGAPSQLTRGQVASIKQIDNDLPILTKTITISSNRLFQQSFNLLENDVMLITLKKL